MKKLTILAVCIFLFAVLLGGCGSEPVAASSEPSESLAAEPISTTPPDAEPTNNAATLQLDEDAMAVTHDGWIYYLDINDAAVVDYNEDPPLHMEQTDGSGDQDLGMRGFQYDIIGDYIYVDSNDTDLDDSGTQTWGTTRMNLDGSDKIKLEYPSMSTRYIPEGEESFYFTTTGDSAIYISDFSCENVTTLIVVLPDQDELAKEIGTDNVLQLDINAIEDGYIDFDATFSTADGLEQYNGNYKISEDGQTIEKVEGTYYSYGTQENE